jgi:hypothetical protein
MGTEKLIAVNFLHYCSNNMDIDVGQRGRQLNCVKDVRKIGIPSCWSILHKKWRFSEGRSISSFIFKWFGYRPTANHMFWRRTVQEAWSRFVWVNYRCDKKITDATWKCIFLSHRAHKIPFLPQFVKCCDINSQIYVASLPTKITFP